MFFFQYERMNTPGRKGRKTTICYWNENKNRMIDFSKKQKRDLFSTLNFYNHVPSQFPIIVAAKIYRYFNATKILDPYAGWGDRCLAALAMDIDYTGIDSNPNLEIPFQKLCNYYPSESNCKIYIDKCENIDIDNIDFDFVLTSPPFWYKNNLLEVYNNTESNYDIFLNNSLIPILNRCLDKNVWICLYIDENMYSDLVKVFGESNKKLSFNSWNKRQNFIYCWKK